jgi:site-specific DNA recombinase
MSTQFKGKTAIVYDRVSSDEQLKGYSPALQKELLTRFCEINQMTMIKPFSDDFTGKTFNRPGFNAILKFVKENKGKIDFMLFTNWSRFGRNIHEAYNAIDQLARYGVVAQAIEQPLNMKDPESTVLLAMYLSMPDAENRRRSKNTIGGMHKALRSGRYLGKAPKGYLNKRDNQNKPVLIPDPVRAPIIREAFERFAAGNTTVKDLNTFLNSKGIPCSRAQGYELLRNPVYMGKVVVPANDEEPQTLVDGIHEAIVPPACFYRVQDVITGRKRCFPKQTKCQPEELPLRGFLVCPECGGTLTGSSSRGYNDVYYYYHCQPPCKVRFNAKGANEEFVRLLEEVRLDTGVIELYQEMLNKALKMDGADAEQQGKLIDREIAAEEAKKNEALDLLLNRKIGAEDFQAAKQVCEKRLALLAEKREQIARVDANLVSKANNGLNLLKRLDSAYLTATLEAKKQIISSIFPEKLTLTKEGYRTTKMNEAVALILTSGAGFRGKKLGLNRMEAIQSSVVARRGIEPLLPE